MITAWNIPMEQRWPNGEVPYELPGVWAAHDALIDEIEATISEVNDALGGQFIIRPRRAGDRDYLVLKLTTQPVPTELEAPGCHHGAQPAHCQVAWRFGTPTLVPSSLIWSLFWAIGLSKDPRQLAQAG